LDHTLFDRLTRRIVLAGLAGGALATWPDRDGTDAAKLSRRKRCKRKNRDFCAGRCCPKGRRCENGACVASCNDPFQCPPAGSADLECGPEGSCFCGKTPGGKAACVGIAFPTDCNELPVCGGGMRCSAGLVCFTCFCSNQATTPNFRCAPPC
jgi:hypothetical protein